MKKIHLLFTLILTSFLFSQNAYEVRTIQEANTFGGGQILSSTFDENGNHYSLGIANGNFYIDNQNINSNNNSVFIYKTKKGSFEKDWLKVFTTSKGTNVFNLSVYNDQYNNIFVYFAFIGKVTIGNNTFDTIENGSGVLINFDTSGNIIWVKNLPDNTTFSKQMTVSTEDYIYNIANSKVLTKLNRRTGETIEEKVLPLSIHSLKSKNEKLFASGINFGSAVFDGQEFNNDIYILALDKEFKLQNSLKIKKQASDTSFGEFKFNDFYIDNHQNVTFLVYTTATAFNLLGNNQVLQSVTNNKYTSKICLGKVNSSFTNLEWLSVNETDKPYFNSYDQVQLIEKDNSNFYLKYPIDGPYKITFNNSTYSFNNKALIELDSNGIFQTKHYYESNYLTNYKNINNVEYITTHPGDLKIYTLENNNFDKLLKTYLVDSNYGYIENAETLLTKNKSIFISTDGSRNIANYFGEDIYQPNRSTQLAKIKENQQLDWYLSMDNTTNYKPDNQNLLTAFANRIDVNNAEESLIVAECYNSYYPTQNYCEINGPEFGNFRFSDKTLIFKVSKEGRLLWQNALDPEKKKSDNTIRDLSVNYDNIGNAWVTGHGTGKFNYDGHLIDLGEGNTALDSNFFILKLNADGDFKFLKKYPYTLLSKIFVEFDSQNQANIILNAETSTSNFTFDNFSVNADKNLPQTIKMNMDQNGNLVSLKNLSPTTINSFGIPHFVLDTKLTSDGQILFGYTRQATTLDNQSFNNPYNPDIKYANIITKIDKNANIIWSKPIIPSSNVITNIQGKVVDVDSKNNIYISHAWAKKIKYQNTEIDFPSTVYYENVVLKLDKDSNLITYKKLGNHDRGFKINIDAMDNIRLSGTTFQNNISEAIVDNRNGYNVVLLSLEEKQLASLESRNTTIIYPNPTVDFINIKDNKDYNKAKVYDATAKLVLTQNIKNDRIEVKSLPKGIYYLELIGKKTTVVKFIKE